MFPLSLGSSMALWDRLYVYFTTDFKERENMLIKILWSISSKNTIENPVLF
jgi:hypothetical protein